jgi:hypothetical protein
MPVSFATGQLGGFDVTAGSRPCNNLGVRLERGVALLKMFMGQFMKNLGESEPFLLKRNL